MVACFGSSIKLEWSHRLRVALCTPSRLATSCVEYNFICPATNIFVYRCQGIIQEESWNNVSVTIRAICADKPAPHMGILACTLILGQPRGAASFFRQPKAPPHLVPVIGQMARTARPLLHVFHLTDEVSESLPAKRVFGCLAGRLTVESR